MKEHLTHEEQRMVEAKVCIVHKARMERRRGQLWKCPVCERQAAAVREAERRRAGEQG